MQPDRTFFIDMRHSALQARASLRNTFPMPIDKLPEAKVLKRNLQEIGTLLGWDKQTITHWRSRSMYYLILIPSSLPIGPLLQAYAFCRTSDVEMLVEKMQCENSQIYPYSPPVYRFWAPLEQTRRPRFEPEEQDPECEEEEAKGETKLNMRKVDKQGLLTSIWLIQLLSTSNPFQELLLAVDGFEKLNKHYQFLCLARGKQLYTRPKCGYPNEILCQKLYLGDKAQAMNFEVLKNLGITHVLNVTSEVENYFSHLGIEYCKINISDQSSTQIRLQFPLAFDFLMRTLQTPHDFRASKKSKFTGHYSDYILKRRACMTYSPSAQWLLQVKEGVIDVQCCLEGSKHYSETYFDSHSLKSEAKQGGNVEFEIDQQVKSLVKFNGPWANECKVLVHCQRGASRSATIVLMFLMRKFNISLCDAFKFLKSRRECIDPNPGFIRQLQQFEKTLFA